MLRFDCMSACMLVYLCLRYSCVRGGVHVGASL